MPDQPKCYKCLKTLLHDDYILVGYVESKITEGQGRYSQSETRTYCIKCNGQDWYSPELSDDVKDEISIILERLDVPEPDPPETDTHGPNILYDYAYDGWF